LDLIGFLGKWGKWGKWGRSGAKILTPLLTPLPSYDAFLSYTFRFLIFYEGSGVKWGKKSQIALGK
jgi:hypothetical protein